MPGTRLSSTAGLHRLIYVSRDRTPAYAGQAETLAAIVRHAERLNAEAAVASLLLAHEGYFLQALEGPGPAVMAVFRRIYGDPRHGELRVIISGPADRREFGDGGLCVRRPEREDAPILAALGQGETFDPDRLSGRTGLWLLMAMRRARAFV
jgi:hypothetical protein